MSIKHQPAFPGTVLDGNGNQFDSFPGMSKREYFAIMAMQALLTKQNHGNTIEEIAKWSTRAADALINALEKPS